MRIILSSILTVSAVLLMFAACSDNSDSPTESKDKSGVLRVLITDAPGDFDAVNVTISEVSVHFADGDSSAEGGEDSNGNDDSGSQNDSGQGSDNGSDNSNGQGGAQKAAGDDGSWILITDEEQDFNLLTLSDGATALLGDKELEAGSYTQMRLEVTDAEVVIGGETFPVTIPSGTIKLIRGFEVVDGETTELVVDFDASRSIHEIGKKSEYQLKPTVRLVVKKDCGTIIGTVTNPENAPVAYAIAGADTVNTSIIDSVDGGFTLGFLPPGTYTVAVADTLGQMYENTSVAAEKGKTNDLGEITLE